MLPLIKPPHSAFRLRYTGPVGVAGVGVQQTWDLTALPEAVRATRDFKQSILVFVQQIDSGVSSVASAVSFLPVTGTPTTLVLTLTAAATTDVLALDVWYLHSIEGLAAGSQAYFVAKPGAGSGAQENIIWRPGVPSNGAVVETWAEVEARIAATSGNIIVQVDSSIAPAIIPEETDTECFGRVQLVGYTLLLGAIMTVTITDGGRLRNLFTVKSVAVNGVCTQHDMLLQNVDGGVLICREGGQVNLELGSTKSAIRMAGTFSEIAAFEGATFNNNAANPLLAMIAVEPGKVIIHAIISQAGSQAFSGADAYSPQLFSGDATTTLLEILDSSAPQVTQTLFLGTVNAVPMSTARGTSYDDTLVLPLLGSSNVQGAIDALKLEPGLRALQVAASQAITPGFTYAAVAPPAYVLTLPAGVDGARFAVYDPVGFGPGTVVAFGADMIVDDTGLLGASAPLPGSGDVRTWQYTSAGAQWFMLSREPTNKNLIPYTPAAPANWAGSPTDVWTALDRLAAAVAGLLGGPIP